jgi:hypothetical protein
MKCHRALLIVPFLFAYELVGQIQQQADGPCSVTLVGNNNQVYTCKGMDDKVAHQILQILNRIAKNQLNPELVMAKLDEIGRDVKNIRRGVYAGYDFNGARREQRPGSNRVIAGEEFGRFQQMISLQKETRWAELLAVAEEQITKTPDWLTPYLFSGIANANLGRKAAAIDRLTFVQQQAADDPAYADAARILTQLH